MKKIILLTLVSICLLSSCKNTEKEYLTAVPTKVYVQVVAYNADGTFFNSEIEIAQ